MGTLCAGRHECSSMENIDDVYILEYICVAIYIYTRIYHGCLGVCVCVWMDVALLQCSAYAAVLCAFEWFSRTQINHIYYKIGHMSIVYSISKCGIIFTEPHTHTTRKSCTGTHSTKCNIERRDKLSLTKNALYITIIQIEMYFLFLIVVALVICVQSTIRSYPLLLAREQNHWLKILIICMQFATNAYWACVCQMQTAKQRARVRK